MLPRRRPVAPARLLAGLLLPLLACGPDVSITKQKVDADNDGYDTEVDCDDAHATVNPDAPELCDGRDNDCDGEIDEEPEDGTTTYTDADGDGAGDPATGVYGCDGGGVTDASDCDDAEARAFPGNTEVCDGIDNDCDGEIDGQGAVDPGTWYADSDGDTYGDPALSLTACDAPDGYVEDDQDCDDGDAAIHPDAAEADCTDPTDYNCDGSTSWADADGDGAPACLDCDDADATRSPDLPEICDAADTDEDCDGVADDDDESVTDALTWYRDVDADGYAPTGALTQTRCDQPTGYVAALGDCDDLDSGVSPSATEVCDDADTDEDCDGLVEDADPSVDAATWLTWYRDGDADTFGDASRSVSQCEAVAGYVPDATDCDDGEAGVNPGAAEVCDDADTDEDCDGLVDDADPSVTGTTTRYTDADADGYGDASHPQARCDRAAGTVADATDCDDAEPGVNPGAIEVCDAADTDEDCDGLVDDADPSVTGTTGGYVDGDGDGYGGGITAAESCDLAPGTTADSTDCDDAAPAIHPGATEICDASDADEDCDGLADDLDPSATGRTTWYLDGDGDGYGGATTLSRCEMPAGYSDVGSDCDDTDASLTVRCGDGLVYDLGTADTIIRGRMAGAYLGARLAGNDADGDGDADLWIASHVDNTGGADAGAVYLVTSPPSGTYGVASVADASFYGTAGDLLGSDVTSAGDVDGDGKDDIFLSARFAGYVALSRSPHTGSSTFPGAADARYTSSDTTDGFGVAIAAEGAVDGDTTPDLLVGAFGADDGGSASGEVFLFLDATSGTHADTAADAHFIGETTNDYAGLQVAFADTDGDGLDDVVIAAPREDGGGTDAGAVYVVLGPTTGTTDLGAADAKLSGSASENAGIYLHALGDLDTDGYEDLGVGASGGYSSSPGPGAVYLVHGPVSGTSPLADADATLPGESAGDNTGAVAPAGDVDGDGNDDVLIAATLYGVDAGQAWLFYGPLLGTIPVALADVTFTADNPDSFTGSGLAGVGDVDGDGVPDAAIGASYDDTVGSNAGALYFVSLGGL